LEDKLAILVAQFDEAIANKNAAGAQADKCAAQMNLATRLTTSLASENDRWAEGIIKLEENLGVIVGDVLLAAGFVSYVGPFSKVFRDKILFDRFFS